jgi:hypothetical protein
MEEIADWLEKLGMSEYTQSFAEHRIDVSVLRHRPIKISKTSASHSGIGEKYSRRSVSLPALPRRHPNLPERSRAPTPPNAAKSR